MFKVLASPSELENAEKAFEASVKTIPHQIVLTDIGYQGGTYEAEIAWLPSLGIWAFFGFPPEGKSEGLRFWNVFGIDYPGSLVSIVCEINPSRGGINKRTKGAFVVDENGKVLVCHRGMFNIAGGMKKEFFSRHYRGTWIDAQEGTQFSHFVKVAQIGSLELGTSIRDFVLQVDRIKKLARSS